MKRYRLLHLPTSRFVIVDQSFIAYKNQMGREMSRASLVDYFIQVNYGLEGLWFDSDGEYIKCLIPLEFTNKRHFKTLLSISMEPKIQLFYCISYDLGLVDRGGQTSNSKRINMCKEEFDIIEVKSKS